MARNIVKSIKAEIAVGTRQCDVGQKHDIQLGEAHLAGYDSFGKRKNICLNHAGPVLDRAADHIAAVRAELGV